MFNILNILGNRISTMSKNKSKSGQNKSKQKCKCCATGLTDKLNAHLIFDESGLEKNIQFLLSDCLGKYVDESDGLDQAICNDCFEQLKQSFLFKQKCRNQCEDEEQIEEESEDDESDNEIENREEQNENDNNDNEFSHENIIELDNISTSDKCTINVENIPSNESYDVIEMNDEIFKEEDFAGFDLNDTNTVIHGIIYERADTNALEEDDKSLIGLLEDNSNTCITVINSNDHIIESNILFVNSIEDTENVDNNLSPDNYIIDETDLKFEEEFDKSNIFRTSLTECLTAQSYKDYLRKGIPIHQTVPKRSPETKTTSAAKKEGTEDESTSLDVQKIVTSDDLIKILEDDYHSENDSKRKRLDKDTDCDEFKIPKIKIFDVCENVEYLEEANPIDIDEYIMSVVCASYDEELNFLSSVTCRVSSNKHKLFTLFILYLFKNHFFQICNHEKISNYVELLVHTNTNHSEQNEFECILGNCMRLPSLNELKNHLFVMHNDVIQ